MLKVGVQTKGILPDMSVDKGFQFIKDAGFEKVDLRYIFEKFRFIRR